MKVRQNIQRARQLRLALTDAEAALWKHLRGRRLLGAKFRRQFPVSGFVVDFVCLEARLVIEIDGGQHADRTAFDDHRTRVLSPSGFRTLRFWNDEVLKDPEGVLAHILLHLPAPPSPQRSPASGRGG